MKKKILLFLISFFILFQFNSSANDKIVFIDMDLLIKKSIAGIKIKKDLEELQSKKNKYFEKLSKQLRKQEDDLIAKKNLMEQNEFNKQVTELKKKIVEFQDERKKFSGEIQNKKIKYLSNFVEEIHPILIEYSEANTLSLIVDKKNVVLGNNNLDITNDILVIIDKKIKSVKLD